MAPINPALTGPLLTPRQSSSGSDDSSSSSSCPSTISGGGIAGIVIGSIAGTLLVIWLWRLCVTGGAVDSDVAYRSPPPPPTRRRRRRRGSTSGGYVDYVEKPRRYRDDVRRPESVYLARS